MKLTEDNIIENKTKEPLFTVVIPKRRCFTYKIKYYIRGLKIVQSILGPQIKALPPLTRISRI